MDSVTALLLAVGLATAAPAVPVATPDSVQHLIRDNDLIRRWWQWRMNLPADDRVRDIIDVDCTVNQPDGLWFLAGSFELGQVRRACTIPHGTLIFFPVFAHANHPPRGVSTTCEAVQTLVRNPSRSEPTELVLQINGVTVPDIRSYRMDALECFPMFPDSASYAGAPAFATGYWVALPNLPVGEHHLRFYRRGDEIPYSEVWYTLEIASSP